MKGLLEYGITGKWNDTPAPLTEKDFVASLPLRHKDCDCPLCELDKRVMESVRDALFGKK